MDTLATAWVAGLIEGEGAFVLAWHKSNAGPYPEVRIQCNMTDEDVIRKLHAMTGVGTVRGPYVQWGKGEKPVWRWDVSRRELVDQLMSELLPHMGKRRAEKIAELQQILSEHPPRERWRHGTRQGYEVHACRCDLCRASNTKRHRERRATHRDQLLARK